MRATTARQQAALRAAARSTRVLVQIDTTGAGNFADVNGYGGHDWRIACEISDSIDSPCAQARVVLRRQVAKRNLSPLVTATPPNQQPLGAFVPALTVNRAIRIDAAVLGLGESQSAGDLQRIFEGVIDDLDFGGGAAEITIGARDKAGVLVDTFIENQIVYGSAYPGTAVETVMQSILTDNGLGAVVLYTPVSPGFQITKYIQQKEPVAEALRKLAAMIGWDVRYKWDSGTSAYRLTLYQPDRAKVVPDWTFEAREVLDVQQARISKADIRNVVRVIYTDGVTKVRVATGTSDPASIAKYGRRFMELVEAASSQIDSAAEGLALATAAVSDLSEPNVEQSASVGLFWPAELGDLYRFRADGEHYDADQSLAVVSWRHAIGTDRDESSFQLRGKPSGGFARWLRAEARSGIGPTSDFDGGVTPAATTQPTLGGVIVTYDDPRALSPPVADWHTSECHVDGPHDAPPGGDFTPTAGTLRAVGRQTRFEVTNLVPGKYYRIKVVVVDAAGNKATATTVLTQASVLVGPYNTNLATEQGGNLVPNGDFEVTTLPNVDATTPPDNWKTAKESGGAIVDDPAVWGAASDIYVDATVNASGLRSVKIVKSATYNLPTIRTKSLPMMPNKPYRFSALLRSNNAAAQAIVALRQFDAAGAQVGLVVRSGTLPVAVGNWYYANVLFRTATTAAAFSLEITNSSATAGHTLWVDKAEIRQAFSTWRLTNAAGGAIPNAAYTQIAFPTVVEQGASEIAASQIIAREAGVYAVTASARILNVANNARAHLAIFKNGVILLRGLELKAAGAGDLTLTVAADALKLEEGDTIDVRAYHNSGGGRNLGLDPLEHFFSGVRLA